VRPAGDVLREAAKLVTAGVKLLVISPDTSAYSVDLKYAASRETASPRQILISPELGEFGAWVRLQYVYPYPHVDEVIGLMTQKICLSNSVSAREP
jgi:ribosomal protein S12 methylthiotransferase